MSRARTLRSLLLALAASGTAVVLLLEPSVPHDRAAAPPQAAPPVAAAAVVAPVEAEAPVLRVSIRDAEDLPIAGARIDVEPWGAAAWANDSGIATIPVPAGARATATVHAWKEGYRPASRRRFAKDDALKLKLIKEPEIRVLDQDGRRVANVGWENEHADLRQRKLHAPGYLDLDLADVPRELLAAWDDLLARTPVDIYLVSDAGLGKLALRVEHPGYGGTRVLIPANVSIDWTRASRPDLSPRLRALPHGWRGVYAKPVDWLSAEVFGGEEIRVYAEGTVVVTCIALDCRPLRVAIDVAKGATAERAVVLEPEPWVPQEIVVTDRFGREGPVALAIVDPARVPLASHARVPRGGGPYTILADGGSRGSAVRTVETLPTKEPIRLELTGIEVRLRVVDEESGDPIEGLALRLGDRPVEWRAEDGEYVLGPVDPGTIRLVDDAERTIDIRVDPAEAEKGILKKEVRVRVLPRGGS